MPAKRMFDAELAAVEALRAVPPEVAAPELAKVLLLRNNFLVAKAAALMLHHGLTGFTTELVAAFHRFLEDAATIDPQGWAKNAIAKALAAFEYQEPELFLAGMRHIQLEPVWGGSADTAGALRGTCALALVHCRELPSHRVLIALTPLFADKDLPVQGNTRQEEPTDWLLGLVTDGSRDAEEAHEALCRSAPSAAMLERLRQCGKPCL